MLEKLIAINAWVLILGACLTVAGSPIGSFVFLYTCVIGLIDGIKEKNFNAILINGALGGMNTYYVIVFILSKI
jgi:hypothetical protein